jgi:glycosyltransferase involved in cell wall biosynthesis
MISIIIPTFNRAHIILETIDSIKNQSYRDWECIVIDDQSTDDSIALIKDYVKNDLRFTILSRPKHYAKGPSSCRNYAFKLTRGQYIQFFDSDDIMHSNHLQEKMENIKDNDFVVCKQREFQKNFNQNLLSIDDVEDIKETNNIFESFVTGEFPMMMVAPMWKKNTLEQYMPIREDMHILEDHELYARALFTSKKYKIVNKVLIYVRVGLTSSTNSFYNNIDYGLDSYFEAKRTILRLSNSDKIKLAILKMVLGYFRMGLSQKKYNEAKKCLNFIDKEDLCYSKVLRLKLVRIKFFYYLFKILKRGETKGNYLLKL